MTHHTVLLLIYISKKGARNSQWCPSEDVMGDGSLLRVPLAEKSALRFLSTSWQLLLLL